MTRQLTNFLGLPAECDSLSDLVSAEVSITAAATLTSTAFGKMHVISGTTADYDVVLPTAIGNSGKIIGIRIADNATRFFTIKGNSTEVIDGFNERVMWQSESATLLCDGVGWTKIAGKSRPLKVTARRDAVQTLNQHITITMLFDTILTDPRESSPVASLIYNTSNGLFTAPRNSLYLCSAYLRLSSDAVGFSCNITRNGTTRFDTPNIAMSRSRGGGLTFGGRWSLEDTHNVRCTVYLASSSQTLTATGAKPTFTVTEIPEW